MVRSAQSRMRIGAQGHLKVAGSPSTSPGKEANAVPNPVCAPSIRHPPLFPRLSYHAALGVSRLYLLYDGSDPDVTASLAPLPLVEVMAAGGPLATQAEAQDYAAYLARHDNNDAWKGRPGNYKLLVKQGARGGARVGLSGGEGRTDAC